MRNPFKYFLICLILLASYGLNAQDQEDLYDMSLEDLLQMEVISASKSSEKLSDAPGIIQVISKEEIDRFGALNLAEVLDRVTGALNMSSITYPQNKTSLRGDLSNEFDTHVLLLMNGRPMRESIYGGFNSAIYLSFPVSVIERIEVIRGPGSVLYGSNAYVGVINIIVSRDGKSGGEINLSAGSFGTVNTSAAFRVNEGKLELTGGLYSHSEEGWEFTATDLIGETNTIDFMERNKSFVASGGIDNLSFDLAHFDSEQSIFALSLPVWDLGLPVPLDKRVRTKRTTMDMGYEINFSDKFKTDLNVTYNELRVGLYTGNTTILNLRNDGSRDWLFEAANYYNASDKVNILFGGTIYNQTGQLDDEVLRYENHWYSLYSQVDYKPVENLKLTFGGQYNAIEGLEKDFVPRLGVIYNATEKLGGKLLYGESFRAPYAFETLLDVPGIQAGNPDLNSEKLNNLDVQLFYTDQKFELYATYFNYNSSNAVIQRPRDPANGDLTSVFVNQDTDLTGNGYSLEAKFIPNNNILLTGSFSHQQNESEVGGNTIENYTFMPKNMFKLGASYSSNNGFFTAGLYNMYLSEFFSDRTEIIPPAQVNNDFKPLNLLSANLKFNISSILKEEIREQVIIGLYCTNLLDQEVNFPEFATNLINSIPGRSGRAIYGTLTVKF